MAIYHLEAKVVSRGVGRSACAAAAYMSCSAIYNDYDGIPSIAAALENLRKNMILLRYMLTHKDRRKQKITEYLSAFKWASVPKKIVCGSCCEHRNGRHRRSRAAAN